MLQRSRPGVRNVANRINCRNLRRSSISHTFIDSNPIKNEGLGYFTIPKLIESKKPGRQPENKQRNYWKHLLKTQRDKGGAASTMEVFRLEIEDAIRTFNSRNEAALTMEDVLITPDLGGKFSFYNSESPAILGVEILYHTSGGDGLAFVPRDNYLQYLNSNQYTIVRVPKTIPGDIVSIKIGRHFMYHADGELLKVENVRSRTTRRNDRHVVCKHFDKCSGCQLQMLSNEDQLSYKQKMLRRAYEFYYPELLNRFSEGFGYMVASPMQYSYRTKITPHYKLRSNVEPLDTKIGFNDIKNPVGIVDVDYCPIASRAINQALPTLKSQVRLRLEEVEIHKLTEKARVKAKISPTLLLRNSIRIDHNTGEFEEVCITNQKNVVTEKVNDLVFQFEANEFFQNNAAILPHVLDYIEYHIADSKIDFKYLVDTYCGSGFFGIALSKLVTEKGGKIFGIEISERAIKYAKHNAKINGLYIPDKIDFISGDSDLLFKNQQFIDAQISGEDSVVIMDPSRKGSTESFMQQLLTFKPKMVVYISCNPFSQARDLATLNKLQQDSDVRYRVKDIAGFDFFPQTKHVESVAILERE